MEAVQQTEERGTLKRTEGVYVFSKHILDFILPHRLLIKYPCENDPPRVWICRFNYKSFCGNLQYSPPKKLILLQTHT